MVLKFIASLIVTVATGVGCLQEAICLPSSEKDVNRLVGDLADIAKTLQSVESTGSPCVMPASSAVKSSSNSLGKFPGWTYKLSKLAALQKRLEDDKGRGAKALGEELKRQAALNPLIREKSTKEAKKYPGAVHQVPQYDDLRLGRARPELGYLNACECETAMQTYILLACPKTKEELSGVLTCVFADPSPQQVWVSLHEVTDDQEGESLLNDFCSKELLLGLSLRDNWKITNVTQEKVATGTVLSKPPIPTLSEVMPNLVMTTIEATNGSRTKTVVNLRYYGWFNKTAVPDEDLLIKALDMTMEKSPGRNSPIMVNCHGGVGRTGMFTVLHYLWTSIRKQVASGIAIDDIEINLPELVYVLREKRAHLCENTDHFAKIVRILQKLVDREKAHPSIKIEAPS
jgi:protein tyrosine phosphatase